MSARGGHFRHEQLKRLLILTYGSLILITMLAMVYIATGGAA